MVPHTHWDREWYHSSDVFRTRLVALVDALLAQPVDSARPFLLDGQAIVVDDYLAVRPENREQLRAALASGALEAGPWYVLADNLIPSGEALVRNLEAGRRRLAEVAASAPAVLYCPDTFGHPAALPFLAEGFGCPVTVVWRGFGGCSFPRTDTARWEHASGSRVLLYHLPPDGYEFGSALPVDRPGAEVRWRELSRVLRARNASGVVMLLSGADHHAAPPTLDAAIAMLHDVAANAADDERGSVMRSGLGQAAGGLAAAAAARGSAVPVVRGELRDSYGHTWTLQGTLATRAHQKRRNAELERALVYDVEPWGVLAWLHGGAAWRNVSPLGATTQAQWPALLARTWEQLLRTHPHDTLCGCSSDDVATAMSARQRRVRSVLPELQRVALGGALQHDVVAARSRDALAVPAVVIRNAVSYARAGLAELELVETVSHVGVGPHSVASPATQGGGPSDVTAATPMGAIPMQLLSTHSAHRRRESPQHYPDNDLVRVRRVLAWVPLVPPLGVRVMSTQDAPSKPPLTDVSVERNGNEWTVDNGLLRFTVSQQDGLTIEQGQRRLLNALSLETTSDGGDSYTPSLRGDPARMQVTDVRCLAEGPLRATVQITWRWLEGRERIHVTMELSLDAGTQYLRCRVKGKNQRRNHRLQLVCNTDVSQAVVTADAAFGAVVRTPIPVMDQAVPYERPVTTMPLHRWISTHDAQRGVAVISDGLAEAEVGSHRMAVTLVRAIGELSKADLPERPGHAGWPMPIPRAQCQRRFGALFGILLHDAWSNATAHDIGDTANALLLPLRGETWRDLAMRGASEKSALSGPALHGDDLVMSTAHVHPSGSRIVLRALNRATEERHGAWELPHIKGGRYRRCRLDGTPLDDWRPLDGRLAFTIGAHDIMTHEIGDGDVTAPMRRQST